MHTLHMYIAHWQCKGVDVEKEESTKITLNTFIVLEADRKLVIFLVNYIHL